MERRTESVERESSLDERMRKDKEKANAIRERQERLGHVPPREEKPKEEKLKEEKSKEEKVSSRPKTSK